MEVIQLTCFHLAIFPALFKRTIFPPFFFVFFYHSVIPFSFVLLYLWGTIHLCLSRTFQMVSTASCQVMIGNMKKSSLMMMKQWAMILRNEKIQPLKFPHLQKLSRFICSHFLCLLVDSYNGSLHHCHFSPLAALCSQQHIGGKMV